VFEMIKNISVVFRKPVKGGKRKKNEKSLNNYSFKKQSIFLQILTLLERVRD
jgi:hypothetical protein